MQCARFGLWDTSTWTTLHILIRLLRCSGGYKFAKYYKFITVIILWYCAIYDNTVPSHYDMYL